MEIEAAKKTIEKNIKRYLNLFQLQHWKIEIEYTRLESHKDQVVTGYCTADPKYRHAIIELDPGNMKSEDDLLRTLRHELCHVMHAEFQVYRRVVAQLVNSQEFNALDEVFNHVCETFVLGMESMFEHGLKIPLKEKANG